MPISLSQDCAPLLRVWAQWHDVPAIPIHFHKLRVRQQGDCPSIAFNVPAAAGLHDIQPAFVIGNPTHARILADGRGRH